MASRQSRGMDGLDKDVVHCADESYPDDPYIVESDYESDDDKRIITDDLYDDIGSNDLTSHDTEYGDDYDDEFSILYQDQDSEDDDYEDPLQSPSFL